MNDPTQQEVVAFIDRGIREAQRNYREAAWTPLCQGPEYLITTSIFDSLLNLTKKDSLTLEGKPSELLKYLEKIPRRGRPRSVPAGARLSGRVDICLWKIGEDIPRAIIEVKRCAENWKKDTKDIDRVSWLLTANEYRKFEFGVLASCIHMVVRNNDKTTTKREINNELREVLQAIKENLGGQLGAKLEPSSFAQLQLKDEYPEDSGSRNWIWRPVIFKIYRKRKSQ